MRRTIKRLGLFRWEWEVYGSAYGLTYGYTRTLRTARRRAQEAILEFYEATS